MIGFIYYSEEHSSNLKILLSPLRHCTTGMLLLILLHGQKVVHYPYPAAFQMISSKIVIAETKKYWDGVQHGHLTTQEEASLALVSNRSGDGVTIKISFRVDVLLDWPPCPPHLFIPSGFFCFFCLFFFRKICNRHHHCHHFHLRFCWVLSIGWGHDFLPKSWQKDELNIKHFWCRTWAKSF